jgi:uncharacterized linocin/CFP29 family protein
MDVNVDLIGNGQSQGQVARMMANNGKLDIGRMRPFIDQYGRSCVTVYMGGNPKKKESWKTMVVNAGATLRREEWKALDEAIMEPSRARLGGIEDLTAKNLVYNLGNAMGTTVLEWHDVNEALEAEMTMDGITRGKNDRVTFQHNYLPLPIIHAEYEINTRELAASRNLGNPLDTTMAERAARKVLEKLEALLFTDTTYTFGEKDSRLRNAIYSYVNFPDRIGVNLSIHWDNSGITGAMIIQDVLEMKQASINNYHYGPWTLYIPTNYETVLDADYDATTPGTTIRERILKIAGVNEIKVSDTLADDNVLLIQMTRDVIRLVRGMGLQNVQWSEEGGMVTKFKVMTIQVPQIRSDAYGKTGIVHLA